METKNGPGTSRGQLRRGRVEIYSKRAPYRAQTKTTPARGRLGSFQGAITVFQRHSLYYGRPRTDPHDEPRPAPIVPGACPKISGKSPNQDSTASPSEMGASTSRRSLSRPSTKARHASRIRTGPKTFSCVHFWTYPSGLLGVRYQVSWHSSVTERVVLPPQTGSAACL
jgi:hypothetical protein